ncbi:MAG: EpsG family protein [Eubacteriales bacterium]
MLVYFIIFFFVIIATLFTYERKLDYVDIHVSEQIIDKKRDKYLLIFVFTLIFIVIAFRGDFSADYIDYEIHFSNISGVSWENLFKSGFEYNGIEIGFSIIIKVISLITDEPIWLFVFVTVIILYPIYKLISAESISPYFSIMLFLVLGSFLTSMNTMRCIMAYSILIIALKYIYQKKFLKFCLIVVFAALFHTSVIIMIPIYFFLIFSTDKPIRLLLIVAAVLTMLLQADKIILFFDEYMYGNFFKSVHKYGIRRASIGNIIIPVTIGAFSIFYGMTHTIINMKIRIWMNGTILWTMFRFMTINFIVMRRFADMLSPFMFLFIPYAIFDIFSKKRDQFIIRVFVYLILILYFIYNLKDSVLSHYYFVS